jgi:hypothetical protein
MDEPRVFISIPGRYESVDETVLFVVPLTNWQDEPYTVNVTVTPEGIITDVVDPSGQVIATEGELFDELAERLETRVY